LIVLGVVAFGLLMGVREQFHSIWWRAATAAAAFAILGLVLAGVQRKRSRKTLNR